MSLQLMLAIAFLLGTIPTGLIVVRLVRGVDIRTQGSGNIGATNVVRVAGWGWGVGTLLFDALKGAIIPIALLYLERSPEHILGLQIAAGALTLVGNIFNPFLGFRGGKGVGTAIGVTAVIAFVPFCFALLAFVTAFISTRIVSVGSLVAGFALVLTALIVYATASVRPPLLWLGFCVALGLLIYFTHRGNIARILSGKETRLTKGE